MGNAWAHITAGSDVRRSLSALLHSKHGDADTITAFLAKFGPSVLGTQANAKLSVIHRAAQTGQLAVLQAIIRYLLEAEDVGVASSASTPSCSPAVDSTRAASDTLPAGQCQPPLPPLLRSGTFSTLSAHDHVRLRPFLDAPNYKMQTPLMLAAFYQQPDVLRLLLAAGADPWATSKSFDRTALHYAALSGCTECIAVLLDALPKEERESSRGSERYVDQRTSSGFTALCYAVASRSLPAVRALLAQRPDLGLANRVCGADVPPACAVGSTPLHLAAQIGEPKIALELLRYQVESSSGAASDVDVRRNADGCSQRPCDMARRKGHCDLAAVLHPSYPLRAIFPSSSGDATRYVGVSQLKVVAAAALRNALLASCAATAAPALAARPPVKAGRPAGTVSSGGGGGGGAMTAASSTSSAAAACGTELAALPAPSPPAAAIAATGGNGGTAAAAAAQCNVCCDQDESVSVRGCGHRLCAGCAGQLSLQVRRHPVACPWCRAPIAGFEPLPPCVAV